MTVQLSSSIYAFSSDLSLYITYVFCLYVILWKSRYSPTLSRQPPAASRQQPAASRYTNRPHK
jgi:hypothetical protein